MKSIELYYVYHVPNIHKSIFLSRSLTSLFSCEKKKVPALPLYSF